MSGMIHYCTNIEIYNIKKTFWRIYKVYLRVSIQVLIIKIQYLGFEVDVKTVLPINAAHD